MAVIEVRFLTLVGYDEYMPNLLKQGNKMVRDFESVDMTQYGIEATRNISAK